MSQVVLAQQSSPYLLIVLFFSPGLPAESGELTYDGSALAGPKNKARRLQAGTTGTSGVEKKPRRLLQEIEVASRCELLPSSRDARQL